MHVIDQAEQTRRSLEEAAKKLTQAVEKTLELIARTRPAIEQSDSQPLAGPAPSGSAHDAPPEEEYLIERRGDRR